MAVFAPLKTAYRDEAERLERVGANTIGKEHFTFLYNHARYKAFTPRNIKAGFSACGLLPSNPERVLGNMPKPPPELTISVTNEVSAVPQSQDNSRSPLTLVTPVTMQGLASLQNIIMNQTAQGVDEQNILNVQKNALKIVKVAHIGISNGIL